jgi:hypothetical protein
MQPRTIALVFMACALGIGSYLYTDSASAHSLPRALQFMVYGSVVLTGVLIGTWILRTRPPHAPTPLAISCA